MLWCPRFPIGGCMTQPKILLVDDDQDVLDLGIAILRRTGYRAVPANSGMMAEALLEQGVTFQALITDLVMPGPLDGFALARRARDLDPEIQLIYTTGYGNRARAGSGAAPPGEILPKPWRH